MTKTAVLNEDAHKYLKRVQSILYDKYNVEMYLPDIISHIIQDDAVKDAESMVKRIIKRNNLRYEEKHQQYKTDVVEIKTV